MSYFYTFLSIVLLWIVVPTDVFAQFPVTLTLDARSSAAVQTPVTKPSAKYRITVQGKYSQWPQFTDCHGVDAVWVYDVPKEEIDAFRWPPQQLFGSPFVPIPHWVGDSTVYSFPPAVLGLNPLFDISFRKYLGFRVDGEPLPALPADPVLHRYQVVKAGNGLPFNFQILDSTFNIALGQVLPRYEDNCGSLTVLVEEIVDKDINICDVVPIFENGSVVGLRVDAGVFSIDTNSVDGTVNLLESKDQLGIVIDGKFICPDSLVCDNKRTEPMSFGLLVDVSGSMEELTPYGSGLVSRITALKNSIHSFLKFLQPGDSLFLMRFSQTVLLVRDWTIDTATIGAAVDQLATLGSTALHQALIASVKKLETHSRPLKALVALTDGLNNLDPMAEQPVVDAIRKANVPVYLIALGFNATTEENEGVAAMRRFVAAAPSGKFYRISSGDELEAVYSDLAANVSTEECCRLYFRIPPCDKGQTKRTMTFVFVDGDTILSKRIAASCDLKITSVDLGPTERGSKSALMGTPLPASESATIGLTLNYPAIVTVEVVSVHGVVVGRYSIGMQDIGLCKVVVPTIGLDSGLYLVKIIADKATYSAMIIVQH